MLHGIARRFPRCTCALLAALVLTAGPTSLADDKGVAVPQNVASLDAALAEVRRAYPGRVLKVELESEDDAVARWVYEVKVLTSDGHVLEVELDAVSLQLLGVEGGSPRRSSDD